MNRLISQFTCAPDPVGNRNPAAWVYNVGNQLRDDGTFTYLYDANGNAQSKTPRGGGMATTYTYSPENELSNYQSAVLSSQYKYDGLGRRIQKLVMPGGSPTTTRYVYDEEDILLEYDGNNILQARYLHGPGIDDPLLLERGSQRYYYHSDGLGSITEITDATGIVVKSYLYDSFGNLRNQTGGLLNPYTYTGREYDSESGLLYYRRRYYDPLIGRFLSRDPLGYMLGELNLYTYTRNSPVNFTDPYGLYWGEDQVNWWMHESALPGPYGQPMSEWGSNGPTGWGDPVSYTENSCGTWHKTGERIAIGTASGSNVRSHCGWYRRYPELEYWMEGWRNNTY